MRSGLRHAWPTAPLFVNLARCCDLVAGAGRRACREPCVALPGACVVGCVEVGGGAACAVVVVGQAIPAALKALPDIPVARRETLVHRHVWLRQGPSGARGLEATPKAATVLQVNVLTIAGAPKAVFGPVHVQTCGLTSSAITSTSAVQATRLWKGRRHGCCLAERAVVALAEHGPLCGPRRLPSPSL